MSSPDLKSTVVLGDDPTPLYRAIDRNYDRPLLLWAHPGIGQSRLVESAARRAGLPFAQFSAAHLGSWDGFGDISESGVFREVTIEKFLARGERADPGSFTLPAGAVLYLRDLNRASTHQVDAVVEQILRERKLLNNPLPPQVRVIASALPPDLGSARTLLGPALETVWERIENPAPLVYPVNPLPARVLEGFEQWSMLPSVPRFIGWGRGQGLSEEVLGFLEWEWQTDSRQALQDLHASLLQKSDPFPQMASPKAFADLGTLLAERRPYFSGRPLKEALARAASAADFLTWLKEHMAGWDPERWLEAESNFTLRGEPVFASLWLRNLIDEVTSGRAVLTLADIPVYAAFEQRSLRMWSTQELGDEIGGRFAARTCVTEADLAHLQA